MKKTITVNEAINKGKLTLVYLPTFIILVSIILSLVLTSMKIFPSWIIAIGFVFGFLCGWLTWSYFVNRWKIWAFENVRNVHELKQKAIDQKLIWRTDSWFEKTEFKSLEQKAKLKELEKRFLEKDVYKDDLNVPKETLIFYSKISIRLLLFIYLAITLFGIYLSTEGQYLGFAFLGFGLYLSYDQIKKLRDSEPQIIINDKGIKVKGRKLIFWNYIHNDRVFTRSSGRSSTNYLTFNDEMIDIDDLTVKFEELENLLHVYRMRYENNL